MILTKISPNQVRYLTDMKKSIEDFIFFLKKRYQLFPWHQIQKVKKIHVNDDTRITLNEREYSVKELFETIGHTS